MTEATTTSVPETAAEQPREKSVQIFYSRKDAKGPAVSLWIVKKAKDRSPDIDGTIGEQRVAGYIHSGANGGFVKFIDSKAGKGDNGHYTQVGRGNVVVNDHGIPKLPIRMEDGTTVWAEVSRDAPQDMLVAMGLNLEIQAQKKAAAELKKAAQPQGAAAAAPAAAATSAAAAVPPTQPSLDIQDEEIPF